MASPNINLRTTTSIALHPRHTKPNKEIPLAVLGEDNIEIHSKTGLAKANSDSLNMLMRMLITKIPRDTLKSFK